LTGRAIHPAWGLAELAALAVLFEVTLWVAGPHVATSGYALAFYWAAMAVFTLTIGWLSPHALHRDAPGLRGWGPGRAADDPGIARNAWPGYLILTVAAAAILIVATAAKDPAFILHTNWRRVALKLLIYMVYGSIQAVVFFGFAQTRIRTALAATALAASLRQPLTAVIVAGLFAAAHAPNWPLAAMVLAIGLCWSWLYYDRPNVLLLGASHAVLGTIVFGVLGLFTRIGPFYAHPAGHIARDAIPGLRALVGDLF
jgi:membrane protease YdiL (CAAX protease family)